MIITRHNYEEYFLLYVDNELSVQERRQVEACVKESGDLKEELNMLKQSVLRPDKQVVFQNKGQLMKKSSGIEPINELNYTDYFVLYGDDELSMEENDMVEQFVYKNPQYQTEFELILQARFAPDTSIVFPNKESLYRKAKEEARVIRITWIRIAAAAVVLLFAGAMGWNFFFSGEKGNGVQSGAKTSGQVAVTEPKDSSTKNSTEPKSTTDPETTAPQIAKTTEKTQSKDESAVKNSAKEKIRRNLAKDEERNSPLVGVEKKFVEEKSNLFDEKNVPNIENATNSKVDKVAGLNVPE